ncbi:MAG TPA: DegT/DnrJ/EryC1/StrS family aminotransferase [Terriglobia bacterium]|nr:DegT/DnrJ/EryC1/StrS family aminotransferase [Terriglobia bacterium]
MRKDDVSEMSRRTFLAAVSAAASAPLLGAANPPALATKGGGQPVRSTPLTTQFEGANFIGEEEKRELDEAVETRSLFRFYGFTRPQKARTFEEEFQKFMGVKYALGVTSGTAALHVAINALGVGPGDEVILPAETWHSDYNAIIMTGALPVFCEIDETFAMDPEDLRRKITPDTKVVIPSHLTGTVADMDEIMAVAREHNLKVLEDSAEAIGATYKGKRTGSIGDIGIYSFQTAKMMTSGEGGCVITNDPALYERAIRFHDLGGVRPTFQTALGITDYPRGGQGTEGDRGGETMLGLNYRMNEETGAVLCAQLRKMDTALANHRRMHQCVAEKLKDLPGIKLRPSNNPGGDIGISLDLLLPTRDLRDKFMEAMTAENVPMGVGIQGTRNLPTMGYIEDKVAPHPQWPSFNTPRGKAMKYGAECCPRSIDLKNRYASLYIGPKWTDDDLNDVVSAVTKVHAALLS